MKHCNHPWSGLEIETDGTMRPCCKFRTELYPGWKAFNVRNGIKNYLESDQLRSLQDDFTKGVQPLACLRCWKDEDAGLPSKREIDLARFDKVESGIKFLTLPLGNHCNLKCRICGPSNSTSWIKEWQEITGEKMPVQDWHRDPETWNDLVELAQGCLEIHFHGGEPFLIDNIEHVSMIDSLVKSGNAGNIRLHYSTNGTVMPSNELWESWRSFKCVDIQVSVDDFGSRFEYNRHPAKWETVRDNLQAYNSYRSTQGNFQLSISTTVSAFTVFYLEEFLIELARLRLPKPWFGRLQDPAYYRVDVLPDGAREAIHAKLKASRIKDVVRVADWLLDSDNDSWDQFKKMVHMQDQYRSEKFVDIFPELAKLLDM